MNGEGGGGGVAGVVWINELLASRGGIKRGARARLFPRSTAADGRRVTRAAPAFHGGQTAAKRRPTVRYWPWPSNRIIGSHFSGRIDGARCRPHRYDLQAPAVLQRITDFYLIVCVCVCVCVCISVKFYVTFHRYVFVLLLVFFVASIKATSARELVPFFRFYFVLSSFAVMSFYAISLSANEAYFQNLWPLRRPIICLEYEANFSRLDRIIRIAIICNYLFLYLEFIGSVIQHSKDCVGTGWAIVFSFLLLKKKEKPGLSSKRNHFVWSKFLYLFVAWLELVEKKFSVLTDFIHLISQLTRFPPRLSPWYANSDTAGCFYHLTDLNITGAISINCNLNEWEDKPRCCCCCCFWIKYRLVHQSQEKPGKSVR